MAKPNGCAHCGGADVQAEFDRWFCLDCGGSTDEYSNALPREPKFLVPQRTTEVQHG